MNPLRQHYSVTPLLLPTKSPWRQFKFRMWDGSFRVVPDQVRDIKSLRKWLVRLAPRDAYVSSALYLNPQSVRRKTGPKSANLFIGCQWGFEADFARMEYARRNALKTLDWLGGYGYAVESIIYSGNRSVQIHLEGTTMTGDEDAEMRRKALLVRQMLKDGIKLDKEVCLDSRRIYRLAYSVNGTTGRVCLPMTKHDLEQTDWLDRVPRVLPPSPKLPKTEGKKLPNGEAPQRFILSSIVGTAGRQAPAFRLDGYDPAALAGLSKDYGLGELAVLRDGRWWWAISSKSCEWGQIRKMLGRTDAHIDQDFASMAKRLGYTLFSAEAERVDTVREGEAPKGPTSLAHGKLLGLEAGQGQVGKPVVVERTA